MDSSIEELIQKQEMLEHELALVKDELRARGFGHVCLKSGCRNAAREYSNYCQSCWDNHIMKGLGL